MSYSSSFVQAQPIAETRTAKVDTAQKAKAITRKDTTTKVLLFVAIIACVALAVSI